MMVVSQESKVYSFINFEEISSQEQDLGKNLSSITNKYLAY